MSLLFFERLAPPDIGVSEQEFNVAESQKAPAIVSSFFTFTPFFKVT
jgi:hypothetical protein